MLYMNGKGDKAKIVFNNFKQERVSFKVNDGKVQGAAWSEFIKEYKHLVTAG